MQAVAVLEIGQIVESRLVRQMQTNAPIDANDEEIEVITQAKAGAYGHFACHVAEFELASRSVGSLFHGPHVAGIKKQRAI